MSWLFRSQPVDPLEAQRIQEEIAMLQQHRKVLEAEAMRLELENRETLARVALIEEENQRQRDLAIGPVNVAVMKFHLLSPLKSEDGKSWEERKASVLVTYLLKSTPGGQRSKYVEVSNRSSGTRITDRANLPNIDQFLSTKESVQLFLDPWLQGRLNNNQLSGVTQDGVFQEIKFSPGMLT